MELTDEGRELVRQHMKTAVKFAMLWHNRAGIPVDELIGIANLALCNAAAEYKPGPAGFQTYLWRRVKNSIRHETARWWRFKMHHWDSDRLDLYDARETRDDESDPQPIWAAFKQLSDTDQDLLSRAVWYKPERFARGADRHSPNRDHRPVLSARQ